MMKFILGTLLIVSPLRADAAEWIKVSTAKNGLVVSFDLASVRLFPGAVQAWMKFDSSKVAGIPFPEARALWKINCLNDTQTALSAVSYAADGSVRATGNLPDIAASYEPIVPDSYGDTMRKKLCPYAMGQK